MRSREVTSNHEPNLLNNISTLSMYNVLRARIGRYSICNMFCVHFVIPFFALFLCCFYLIFFLVS